MKHFKWAYMLYDFNLLVLPFSYNVKRKFMLILLNNSLFWVLVRDFCELNKKKTTRWAHKLCGNYANVQDD
jgi:hypothetical protein